MTSVAAPTGFRDGPAFPVFPRVPYPAPGYGRLVFPAVVLHVIQKRVLYFACNCELPNIAFPQHVRVSIVDLINKPVVSLH